MRVTTLITWSMITGEILDWKGYETSDDKVLSLKKGREQQEAVGKQALANSASDQATRQRELGLTEPDIAQLDVQPGHLSQAAQSQLGQDLTNIQQTYKNAKASGLKAIGQRGLASAPTGAESSLLSSADLADAGDENRAFNNAQQQSHADMIAAINARMGLQNIYDPNRALGVASDSAYKQSQQGSLLGDIGRGLTTAASLAQVGKGIHG